MIIHDVVQGTTEWMNLRAGIPTSSCFDKIVTPGGRDSQSREPYMMTLLAERLIGRPLEEEFLSTWADRGNDGEQEAVDRYEAKYDVDTEPIGFITNDEMTVGSSPDRGIVNQDGLVEIKVPKPSVHMQYLLKTGKAYENYRVQTQGQLWISERSFVDLVSYHRELPLAILRIPRDDFFITTIESKVMQFVGELEALYAKCVELGYLEAVRKRTQRSEPDSWGRIPGLASLEELLKTAGPPPA